MNSNPTPCARSPYPRVRWAEPAPAVSQCQFCAGSTQHEDSEGQRVGLPRVLPWHRLFLAARQIHHQPLTRRILDPDFKHSEIVHFT